MDIEIKNLIVDITNNTGIDFNLYTIEGEIIYGEEKVRETIPTDFNGVFSDVASNRTLFKANYRDNIYVGKIVGSGKVERAYAFFISSLIEKKSSSLALLSKEGFIKALLFGELEQAEISRYLKKYFIQNKPVCAMLVTSEEGKINDVMNVLRGFDGESSDTVLKLDESQCVFVKFIEEISGEYRSVNEYAEFLLRSILEELGLKVFIALGGLVKDVAKLGTSFLQALTVQRMCGAKAQGEVRSFKEFILEKMIEDLPKGKAVNYFDLLVDNKSKEIFDDDEMIQTAEEFLENSLNASETSRRLYLHRNTLTYRLDKIEKETGLDLRKFSDAVTFRIITILMKLQEK